MKNWLSTLFSEINLAYGVIVFIVALLIYILGWNVLFVPVTFGIMFVVGDIIRRTLKLFRK